MFYFLLFTGAAMILYGMRGMQKERDFERQQFFAEPLPNAKPDVKSAALPLQEENQEIIADLVDRMSEMEKSLFEHHLKWQMEKEELLGKIRTEKVSSVEVKTRSQAKKAEKEAIEKIEEVKEVKEVIGKEEIKVISEISIELAEEKEEAEDLESKKKPMPDNIRKVMDYEEEGLSIQQIANVTRMNKGEVLLLRNLSKHYRK